MKRVARTHHTGSSNRRSLPHAEESSSSEAKFNLDQSSFEMTRNLQLSMSTTASAPSETKNQQRWANHTSMTVSTLRPKSAAPNFQSSLYRMQTPKSVASGIVDLAEDCVGWNQSTSKPINELIEDVRNALYRKRAQMKDAFIIFGGDRKGFMTKDDFRRGLQKLNLEFEDETTSRLYRFVDEANRGRVSFEDVCFPHAPP